MQKRRMQNRQSRKRSRSSKHNRKSRKLLGGAKARGGNVDINPISVTVEGKKCNSGECYIDNEEKVRVVCDGKEYRATGINANSPSRITVRKDDADKICKAFNTTIDAIRFSHGSSDSEWRWEHAEGYVSTGVYQKNRSVLLLGAAGPVQWYVCLLYTSPSPRDGLLSRMPSSA